MADSEDSNKKDVVANNDKSKDAAPEDSLTLLLPNTDTEIDSDKVEDGVDKKLNKQKQEKKREDKIMEDAKVVLTELAARLKEAQSKSNKADSAYSSLQKEFEDYKAAHPEAVAAQGEIANKTQDSSAIAKDIAKPSLEGGRILEVEKVDDKSRDISSSKTDIGAKDHVGDLSNIDNIGNDTALDKVGDLGSSIQDKLPSLDLGSAADSAVAMPEKRGKDESADDFKRRVLEFILEAAIKAHEAELKAKMAESKYAGLLQDFTDYKAAQEETAKTQDLQPNIGQSIELPGQAGLDNQDLAQGADRYPSHSSGATVTGSIVTGLDGKTMIKTVSREPVGR
jgi:hypothetical protein